MLPWPQASVETQMQLDPYGYDSFCELILAVGKGITSSYIIKTVIND